MLKFYGQACVSRGLQAFWKLLDRLNMWLRHFVRLFDDQLPHVSRVDWKACFTTRNKVRVADNVIIKSSSMLPTFNIYTLLIPMFKSTSLKPLHIWEAGKGPSTCTLTLCFARKKNICCITSHFLWDVSVTFQMTCFLKAGQRGVVLEIYYRSCKCDVLSNEVYLHYDSFNIAHLVMISFLLIW